MKLFQVLTAWLAALAAFSGIAAAVAPAAHADTVSEENQFLALTNQLRSSLGIQQLTPNAQLTQMARNWAANMASQGTISHNPSLTSLAPSNWQQLGENVGVGPTVDAIQTAFINSPEHYANLSKPTYNFVGIGVVDSNGRVWVTVDFMDAPSSGGSAPPATAPRSVPRPRAAPAAAPAAAPHATTAAAPSAPPVTAPAAPAPAPAPTPAGGGSSPALAQVLAQLRTADS